MAAPLSTRACADFMGVGTEYIRACIRAGELRAEHVVARRGRRGFYRVREDDFRAFLVRVGFRRLPPARG